MLPDIALIFIVLGPGVAALLAGFGKPVFGDKFAMVVTTFTVCFAGLLSVYQLFNYAFGADAGHAGALHGANTITHIVFRLHASRARLHDI